MGIISQIPVTVGPLVARVHLDPAANEIGGDVRLEVGERQQEIGLQREDLVDGRRPYLQWNPIAKRPRNGEMA